MAALPIPLAFWGGSPGAGELIVVFAVILLLFGAKKLPSIARTMGRTLEEFRRAARDFSNDMMRADQDVFTGTRVNSPESPASEEKDIEQVELSRESTGNSATAEPAENKDRAEKNEKKQL